MDARGRQTTGRRCPASLPDGLHVRLLAARYRDHAARLLVPARQPHHGQHRPRHLVPPPGARRRLAAVLPRQSVELGRARLCARQPVLARWRAGREHRAGRPAAPGQSTLLTRIFASLLLAWAVPLAASEPAPVDERDALSELWTGMYDITEELVAGAARD